MNKFLVFYKVDGESDVVVETAREIFNKMDLDDCYNIEITKIYLLGDDDVIPCEFYGSWHNHKDPLRMEIRRELDGEVGSVGYGTDH